MQLLGLLQEPLDEEKFWRPWKVREFSLNL